MNDITQGFILQLYACNIILLAQQEDTESFSGVGPGTTMCEDCWYKGARCPVHGYWPWRKSSISASPSATPEQSSGPSGKEESYPQAQEFCLHSTEYSSKEPGPSSPVAASSPELFSASSTSSPEEPSSESAVLYQDPPVSEATSDSPVFAERPQPDDDSDGTTPKTAKKVKPGNILLYSFVLIKFQR